jgi:hypothetical protein
MRYFKASNGKCPPLVTCRKFASNCFQCNTVHPLRLQNALIAPVLYFFCREAGELAFWRADR